MTAAASSSTASAPLNSVEKQQAGSWVDRRGRIPLQGAPQCAEDELGGEVRTWEPRKLGPSVISTRIANPSLAISAAAGVTAAGCRLATLGGLTSGHEASELSPLAGPVSSEVVCNNLDYYKGAGSAVSILGFSYNNDEYIKMARGKATSTQFKHTRLAHNGMMFLHGQDVFEC